MMILLFTVLSSSTVLSSDIEVTTPDGKLVILKSDGTWEYKKITGVPKGKIGIEYLSSEFSGGQCQVKYNFINNTEYGVRKFYMWGKPEDDFGMKKEFGEELVGKIKSGQEKKFIKYLYKLPCKDLKKIHIDSVLCKGDGIEEKCKDRIIFINNKYMRFSS